MKTWDAYPFIFMMIYHLHATKNVMAERIKLHYTPRPPNVDLRIYTANVILSLKIQFYLKHHRKTKYNQMKGQ